MKRLLRIVLFLAVCFFMLVACGNLLKLSGANDKYTLQQFNSLKQGMTYDEAKTVLQDNGAVTSQAGNVVIYSWKNQSGSNMLLTFQNGRLISMAQANLK